MKLCVVIVSTRPGRVGLPIGTWFASQATAHDKFEVDLADLKEIALPFLDEPEHPRAKKYMQAHTRAWAARVEAADAFAFVTPEYNYSVPAPLVNALDFLSSEWAYKPAAFVSYGGISGGIRSVMMAKQILTSLKIVPIVETVMLQFPAKLIDKETGAFRGTEDHEKAATVALNELHRWATALKGMRATG